MTLLAFGNGAPDVFSALSASSDVSAIQSAKGEGFYLAAASSLGAGLFVSSIVASAVAIVGSNRPVSDHSNPLVLGTN